MSAALVSEGVSFLALKVRGMLASVQKASFVILSICLTPLSMPYLVVSASAQSQLVSFSGRMFPLLPEMLYSRWLCLQKRNSQPSQPLTGDVLLPAGIRLEGWY